MTDLREPFWKSDFTADERRSMARAGTAMGDGSYPIPNAEYLDKAIKAVGRGGADHDAIRRHVIKRAKALGLASKIPDGWKSDGTVQKSEDVAIEVALWKSDADHMVYGVVLTPDLEDSQGDIASAEEIQKAAHAWLADYREHDVQHSGTRQLDIVPVESFVAPQDLEIAGQRVVKGAWVLGARVGDAEWERVDKNELTGWSIEGSGIREPVSA